MFTALFQVAKNTFRESLREPIFLLMQITALCLIGLLPFCCMFVFRAQERLILDSSMAAILLFGLGLAVLTASNAISREIDNGTALLLLSKPVQRPVFIIAKILGILGAVTIFWLLSTMATLVSLRIAVDQFWPDMRLFSLYFGFLLLAFLISGVYNYITHASFPMTVIVSLIPLFLVLMGIAQMLHDGPERPGLLWYTIPTFLLILFAIWAMATLATSLSTRLNLPANLMVCLALFLLGLTSDYFIGRFIREPWQDSVPQGKESLWMCKYSFAPTEISVKRWSQPVNLSEDTEFFRVWTARTTPLELPSLGKNPEAVWLDGEGWKKDPNALDAPPRFMGEYDSALQKWNVVRIREESTTAQAEQQTRFTAYVFRRSVNPPRVPRGGSWHLPVPDGGSWLATIAYAIVPNWQLFWMADALASQTMLPLEYVTYGFFYSIVLIALLMLLGIFLFGNREIAGRQG